MTLIKIQSSSVFLTSFCIGVLLTATFSCDQKGEESLIAEGAVPELLADGFKFTEGPASDSKGNVYFTDQPNDRILKWSIDDELTTWLEPSGRSNGLCFDAQDRLWSCADKYNELRIFDEQRNYQVVVADYQGLKLNGPNDVWVAPNGSAYFSDPFYKRPWWDRDTTQQDGQHVYFLSSDHKTLTRVIDDLVQPNGIIGTPDGKLLYVTDISDKKTYRYDLDAEGLPVNGTLFCEMGSDGMTLDERGNLYLTNAGGVFIFNPEGKLLKQIELDQNWTANVCFGGKDMKSLFITAKTGFYRLRMNVRGVGSQ